jgi:hypothetical protein
MLDDKEYFFIFERVARKLLSKIIERALDNFNLARTKK